MLKVAEAVLETHVAKPKVGLELAADCVGALADLPPIAVGRISLQAP